MDFFFPEQQKIHLNKINISYSLSSPTTKRQVKRTHGEIPPRFYRPLFENNGPSRSPEVRRLHSASFAGTNQGAILATCRTPRPVFHMLKSLFLFIATSQHEQYDKNAAFSSKSRIGGFRSSSQSLDIRCNNRGKAAVWACSPHKGPLFSPFLHLAQQEASSLIDPPSESGRID